MALLDITPETSPYVTLSEVYKCNAYVGAAFRMHRKATLRACEAISNLSIDDLDNEEMLLDVFKEVYGGTTIEHVCEVEDDANIHIFWCVRRSGLKNRICYLKCYPL